MRKTSRIASTNDQQLTRSRPSPRDLYEYYICILAVVGMLTSKSRHRRVPVRLYPPLWVSEPDLGAARTLSPIIPSHGCAAQARALWVGAGVHGVDGGADGAQRSC